MGDSNPGVSSTSQFGPTKCISLYKQQQKGDISKDYISQILQIGNALSFDKDLPLLWRLKETDYS